MTCKKDNHNYDVAEIKEVLKQNNYTERVLLLYCKKCGEIKRIII